MNVPPPSREQLQASLRALHAQLQSSPRVDGEARRLLQQLLHDVQAVLHRTPSGSLEGDIADAEPADVPATGRLSRRLESMALDFEAQHPLLATSLRQFVELCSRAGL